MAKVLRVAKSPKSKTHIMYGASLSFKQRNWYLKFLLDRGLLRVLEETHSRATKLYVTTDRGLSFLEAYRRLKEKLST